MGGVVFCIKGITGCTGLCNQPESVTKFGHSSFMSLSSKCFTQHNISLCTRTKKRYAENIHTDPHCAPFSSTHSHTSLYKRCNQRMQLVHLYMHVNPFTLHMKSRCKQTHNMNSSNSENKKELQYNSCSVKIHTRTKGFNQFN